MGSGVKGRTVAAGGVSCLDGRGSVLLWAGGRGVRCCWLLTLPFPGKVPAPGKGRLTCRGLLGTGGGTLTGCFAAFWTQRKMAQRQTVQGCCRGSCRPTQDFPHSAHLGVSRKVLAALVLA